MLPRVWLACASSAKQQALSSRCSLDGLNRLIGVPLRGLDRWRLDRAGFEAAHSVGSDNSPQEAVELDLVTIACNNVHVVSEQIRLLRANLRDTFCHTVIDNSSDRLAGREIESLCTCECIPYVRMPRIYSSAYDPSFSHASALNWAWTNYLTPRSASHFGFLDHDVFPARPTSLLECLRNQPVWGHLQIRESRWYPWPGLCVFDAEWLAGRRLDFKPGPGFDVGGRLYDVLSPALSQGNLEWPTSSHERLREGGDIPQDNFYQMIGDWLHTINASGWLAVDGGRNEAVVDLIRQLG
jgi:hypothetical protein